MAEKPILFSGPMVKAILDGRKTQTRRIIKLPTKNIYEHPKMGGWAPTTIGGNDGSFHLIKGERVATKEQVGIWHQTCGVCIAVPFQVGDMLWVRETWKQALSDHQCAGYKADGKYQCGKDVPHPEAPFHKWRPSIHMPRWASRITLRVTAVKVERLQDISEEDAIAEGIQSFAHDTLGTLWTWQEAGRSNGRSKQITASPAGWERANSAFGSLWESINGPGSWDANPFVAAYTFERVKP